MVKLQVQSRSGKLIAELDVDAKTTVREVKKGIHAKKKALYVSRQRLTLPPQAGEAPSTKPTVLEDAKTLGDYPQLLASSPAVLHLKDLGPQVGYSTVFFWEYFGPLMVYPLFYLFPQYLYPGQKATGAHPLVQTLALAYWSLHYSKRILETFFVHKFGHETMPVFNLYRNCAYYWGFAAFVSYFINHPLYTPPPEAQTLVALGLALVCQLGNWWSHLILAGLRKPGDKAYKIPRGGLFNYVTCANYTFEVWGWVFFSVAVQALPAALFALVGGAQMAQWAAQKHRRLRKLFDGQEGRPKYPRRWIMLPPFW